MQGDNISFNVTVTDNSEVESVWLKIWQGAIGISAVIWQGFLGFVSGNLWSAEVETNSSFPTGEVNYTLYANDSAGNEVNVSGNFTVVDNTFPSVTSLTETPNDPATYSLGQIYEFNATVIDTNLQTVLLEFDGVNYTASAIGDVYNVSLVDLGVGTYNYRWFANDTNGNVNNSETGSYTIDKASTTTTLTTSPASPITYGTVSNFSCVNDAGLTVILYVDGVDKTNENHLDIVRGAKASGYNVSCIADGNQNYTSATNQSSFTIDKAILSGSLTNDRSWTFEYDEVVANIGLSESNSGDGEVVYKIFKDSVDEGSSDAEGGVGTYEYVLNSSGGQNYSANSSIDAQTLTINQNSSYVLSISANPSWAETYETSVNVSGSGCPSQLTCNLYRDDIGVSNPEVIVLGAGSYNYTFNTTGNNNYTSGSVSNILVISQADPVSGMSLTGTSPITYGTAGDFEGTESNNGDGDCVYELFRDGVLVSNPDAEVLGAGSYSYDYNTTGCANYASGEVSDSLTVDKATPVLTFLANGGTSNLSLTYPQQINMSVSASGGSVGLDRDSVDVLSENGLNVTLGVGGYIYRANITGNENYTDVGYEYYNVTISQARKF